MGDSISFSRIIIIVGIGLLYLVLVAILFYVIKWAVQVGIRDAFRERNSGTDFEFKQTKLLAEIARANGVSSEKIEEILAKDV